MLKINLATAHSPEVRNFLIGIGQMVRTFNGTYGPPRERACRECRAAQQKVARNAGLLRRVGLPLSREVS